MTLDDIIKISQRMEAVFEGYKEEPLSLFKHLYDVDLVTPYALIVSLQDSVSGKDLGQAIIVDYDVSLDMSYVEYKEHGQKLIDHAESYDLFFGDHGGHT